ncbi:helix-turn-helix transcriptional regulator [Sphaerisporangium fuscum]|uniref:helix-turn-helix transcriptional regulator n=1 Tax=Sphaerisporangium fuscum TaxID=2835868 RepID=UPI001BDD9383|nr:helix-turn-helix transcriptional regulator [Sphaerisporangium fuscum]
MDQQIGEFLRARRARIQPGEAGLPSYGRRRVPGLRREELALLAGVSVDYYVRLEQGRGVNVSDAVLDAIARVLRLDETEHEHLRDLARPGRVRTAAGRSQRVRPEVLRMLEMMDAMPAFVLGRRMDILAWNALADAVVGFGEWPEAERNTARHTFLDPSATTFYRDWPQVARETVAYLRLDSGRHPGDPELTALVEELTARSEMFGELWARHDVKEKTHGVKLIRHPVAGDLDFGYETLALPGDPDQLIVTYTTVAGSPTDERLRLLTSWTAKSTEPGAHRTATRPGSVP